MPSFDNIPLPEVNLSSPMDLDKLAAKFAAHPMSPEAMLELVVYLKREREKADALQDIENVLRGRLKARYDTLPAEKRETLRTEVAIATYSEGHSRDKLRDRDWTVEHLTEEQLRITYSPDLKAMKTILKADEYARHVVSEESSPIMTIRETRASKDFQELDF